jgi:hypothetical protein
VPHTCQELNGVKAENAHLREVLSNSSGFLRGQPEQVEALSGVVPSPGAPSPSDRGTPAMPSFAAGNTSTIGECDTHWLCCSCGL